MAIAAPKQANPAGAADQRLEVSAPGSTVPNGEIDASVQTEVLTRLARELESRYAVEDMAKKLSALIRAKQKAHAYKDIHNGPQLARVLTDDLYSVAHDRHLRINFSFAPIPAIPSGPPGPPPPEVLSQLRKLNGAIPKAEILDGNVGYVQVNGVPPVDISRPAVAAAFAFLHNTDALIIDNRGNGGGDPNTVALYVSYLSEGKPFVVNTFHWREGNRVEEFRTTDLGDLAYGSHKPVFVLTSQRTFSGGEELSYDLKALKRAVLVGEVTGGGANPGGLVPLGRQFLVNMPGAQAVNPITGTSWEGVGVTPDVPVIAAAALDRAHALAVDQLIAQATDPMARTMLRAVAMKLQVAAGSSGHLTNAEIVGTYAVEAGFGPPLTILESGSRLMEHVDGSPDVALILISGNRYKLEGFSEGVFRTFRVSDGQTEMLLEAGNGPPMLRQKQ
jgi:hypothetical protein